MLELVVEQFARSMFLCERRDESRETGKEDRLRERARARWREKKRNNGLMCVAARYPLRTSNFDTRHVCTSELTHSLPSPSHVVACSSKQTNKSSKINYEMRWETSLGGLRTTEKRKKLMSYATDTHTRLGMKHEKLISRLFSLTLSLYQLDVKQWRWCEMNSPIQISIIYASPINNWLATSWKKRKHARKQSAFLSLSFPKAELDLRSDGND